MEPAPSHEAEVDRATLNAVVRRFRAHHAQRLAGTGERLISRHRRVLEALPMLYHRNHPTLPGYVGPDTPHGIARFRPRPDHVRSLRMVAGSYVEPRLPPVRADLHALFLMGSGGTVGQSRGSDIDLWVCCDTLLHPALWPKVRMIDQWASELGLELHTFLVDPDVLRERRRLPGSRTPMLVLDEFYRSGALMAGRYPLWWLVPEDDPDAYAATAERLIRQRFVPADDVVDFGPVPPVPADELAQAAITELNRALATPHKSLLKLKLMEAYAEAPELGPVSSAYRRRIHAGETRPLALDPYLLLYEHVERHLTLAGREDDLHFARALLIGKTAESVPWRQVPYQDDQAWTLLDRFMEWGFDADDVVRFRSLERWSMQDRLTEHRHIMQALEGGVALVRSLVERGGEATPDGGDSGAMDDRQLHWLNETQLRHLTRAVARMRPRDEHDIQTLHPALISRRRPVILKLLRDRDRWLVLDDGETAVRSCRRLVEAVMWSELNGAHLVPARPEAALTRLLAQVLEGIHRPRHGTCAFVNAESRHLRAPPWESVSPEVAEPSGSVLLSAHNDPLDYGGFHQLHLETLDVVSRDADGHWRIDSYLERTAVLDGIGRLFASPPEDVSWHVPGGQERYLLAHRLERLHAVAKRILDAPGAMFVLPYGADTVTIRRRRDQVETRRHTGIAELQAYVRESGCATVAVDPVSHRLKALLRAG